MILMEFTGTDLLKTQNFEIAPVIIGAITLGKNAGLFLGRVFGLLSFYECFGKSVFGVTLLEINPVLTFLTCIIPRITCGWLAGFAFDKMSKIDKTKFLSFCGAGLVCTLTNTVLFTGAIMLFFGHTDFI